MNGMLINHMYVIKEQLITELSFVIVFHAINPCLHQSFHQSLHPKLVALATELERLC